MPERHTTREEMNPGEVLQIALSGERFITVDEVARLMVREDTGYLLIDVRSQTDYKECHIPGAINLPMQDLFDPDWSGYLDQPGSKKLLRKYKNYKPDLRSCLVA